MPDTTSSTTETIRVTVAVDTDELRKWADHHADRGHHGVAHVLYKAANEGESLTEQALDAARREGATIGRRALNDPGRYVPRGPDYDGEPYGERLDQWQARALDAALEQAKSAPAADPGKEVEALFDRKHAADWVTADGERVMLTRAECLALITGATS